MSSPKNRMENSVLKPPPCLNLFNRTLPRGEGGENAPTDALQEPQGNFLRLGIFAIIGQE